MLGIEPPVCTTECIEMRNIAPASGDMPNTNGMASTMPSLPPSPGMAPKNMPAGTAITISSMWYGEPTTLVSDAKIPPRSMLFPPGKSPFAARPSRLRSSMRIGAQRLLDYLNDLRRLIQGGNDELLYVIAECRIDRPPFLGGFCEQRGIL